MTQDERLRPTPDERKLLCTLEALKPGMLFKHGETIGLKTEYIADGGAIEAFIVGSGEMFWGGTNNPEEQKKIIVSVYHLRESRFPLSKEVREDEKDGNKKCYRLVQGLPDLPMGTMFYLTENRNFYITERNYLYEKSHPGYNNCYYADDPCYHMSIVENSPTWFAPTHSGSDGKEENYWKKRCEAAEKNIEAYAEYENSKDLEFSDQLDYREQCRKNFISANKEWQSLQSSLPSVDKEAGLRWVKANERLPVLVNKPFPAKLDTQYGLLTVLVTHCEFSGRSFFMSFHDRKNSLDFNKLEWLDESKI